MARTSRPGGPVLDRRTLNRTLLARQYLLERVDRSVDDVIEHLVGLQAQEPGDPYVALWSRIEGFDPNELSALIEGRRAVRVGLMRTTLHLVTADDCRRLYPVMRDVSVRTFRSTPFAKALADIELEPIVAEARTFLEDRPHTPSELGARLASVWPERDAVAMAYAARYMLPLVQVPPRGLWRRTSRTANTTAEAWLGTPMDASTGLDPTVLRYLAAFGPASVADMRIWSWLTGLREVVERLRPRLRTFRDEAGRELLDLEDAPIVAGDAPVPIRFLPQYDNAFLSHDDRSRIVGDRVAGHEMGWKGMVLIDGFIAGAWRVRRKGDRPTMTVEVFESVRGPGRVELEEEAARLAAFLAGDGETDLRVVEA